MKYRDTIDENIFLATIQIQEKFPELIKYLDEIPENSIASNSQKIALKDLKDYLDSINELMENYEKEQKLLS